MRYDIRLIRGFLFFGKQYTSEVDIKSISVAGKPTLMSMSAKIKLQVLFSDFKFNIKVYVRLKK